MSSEIHIKVLEQVMAGDRIKAIQLIDQWAADRSYSEAITDVLEPVLHEFGELWYKGEGLSLSHGYIAGKIAEDLMEKSLQEQERDGSALQVKKGPVVIGNIEDDYHSLGRMMLIRFLEISGWHVYDLGNDVLAEEFVDKALEVGAKVIGASAMMYTNALNIKKLRLEIDDRGLSGKVQLAVGGAIFISRPSLVQEVGGDGTAINAFSAVALFDSLWQTAESFGETG